MTYYVGQVSLQDLLGADNPRFFYGMRRSDEGTLYFTKLGQLISQESVTINIPGPTKDNFEDFEYGVDYFDGRLAEDHSRPYPNLAFDQYRWDTRNMYYYINAQGQLVARINKEYVYDPQQIVTP